MDAFNFVAKSENKKTGPIPVTITSKSSCPPSCPFSDGNGCYSEGGSLAAVWRQIGKPRSHVRAPYSITLAELCDHVKALPDGQIWRHNQAGDLPGEGDTIDGAALGELVKANRGKRGFTYTHKPPAGDNAVLIALANHDGFTINLSANNLAHADELADLGIAPVVTVLPDTQTSNTTTPDGRKVVVCPATQRDKVTCATCQLCQRRDRDFIVGFPAHGSGKRAASKIAKGE